MKMMYENIYEWIEEQMETECESPIHVECVMTSIPYHENESRYQVYSEDDAINKLFDLTFNDDRQIIKVEEL